MSQENVDLVRRAYEAWNREDDDWILAQITDDFEMDTLQSLFPDTDELYVGKAGWMKFVSTWRSAWKTVAVDIQRIEDLGDDVLAVVSFNGVGRGSGAVASLGIAHWFTFRGGRLAGLRVLTPEDALEAAGLSQ
jgi:ketosteroid isomerase-like protein